jgi:hypothetical protein
MTYPFSVGGFPQWETAPPLGSALEKYDDFLRGCKVISQKSRSVWPIRAARAISRDIERLTGRPHPGSLLPLAAPGSSRYAAGYGLTPFWVVGWAFYSFMASLPIWVVG